MSSSIRVFANLSRTLKTAKPARRTFHSPFAVLSSSPLEAPPAPSSTTSSLFYEKQQDHATEPHHTPKRTYYVVSEPDPAHTPYEVPSGAYPTSAPYQNYAATDPPVDAQRSSTSSSFAHPFLTSSVPQNESGVGESSAVRFREAQGELGKRGGGDGGLGLMDAASTTQGSKGSLPSRNPQPDQPDVAEKNSKLGIDKAWRERK